MKIKDLEGNLGNVQFLHPDTGEVCIWHSQWGYPGSGAGIWYKKDINSRQVFVLPLDNLKEALEFEVYAGGDDNGM